jgi:hypothetical protein
VVAVDTKGAKTAGPLWSFTTSGDGPSIVSVEVSPPIIFNESATPLLITAAVTHPLGLAAITSITVDLSQIGGQSAQPLYDDGSHGDSMPGDGIYSIGGIVDMTTSVRARNFFIITKDTYGNVAIDSFVVTVQNKVDDSVVSSSEQRHSFHNEIEKQTLLITYYLNSNTMVSAFSSCDVHFSIEDPLGENRGMLQFSEQPTTLEIPNAESGTWRYAVNTSCPTSKEYSIATSSTGTGLIAGTVSDASTGKGLTDALITSDNGSSAISMDGHYLMVVPAGSTALQASASGYNTNEKTSIKVSTGESITQNFSLTSATSSFSISGQLTGAISQGIEMLLTGQMSQAAMSDENGQFSFDSLSMGEYMVAPSLEGYGFDPPSREVHIQSGNVTQVDFTSLILTATAMVQVVVTNSETVETINDATIQCNPGGYTASNGNLGTYSINIPPGSYSITASRDGFKEASDNVTVAEHDVISLNFALTPIENSCPFIFLLGEEHPEVAFLRGFRDQMRQTDRGRLYIKLFRQHAVELTKLLRTDPILKEEAKRILPMLLRQIKTKEVSLEETLIDQAFQFLSIIEDKASGSLKKTIKFIRAEIKKGNVLPVFP